MEWKHKTSKKKKKDKNCLNIVPGNDFLDMTPKVQAKSSLKNTNVTHQKLLCSKGSNHQNVYKTYRMRKNMCKQYIWLEVNIQNK
jgi:hypothetical protein